MKKNAFIGFYRLQTITLGLVAGVLFMTAALAQKSVLVVTTTKGFRHSSIATAEKVLGELADKSKAFTVDYARVDPSAPEFRGDNGRPDNAKVDAAIREVLAQKMSAEALKGYDGVIFANTSGMLPLPDQDAFMKWIRSGKAFIAMHAGSDTFKDWPEYVEMIGGHFKSHGPQLSVNITNMDPNHPATRHFRKYMEVYDEIYLLDQFDREKVHSLLTMDTNPQKDWKNYGHPGDYPVSWCKDWGRGKMFYTSLGHREDVWESSWYRQHVFGGIQWALGLAPGESTPQDTRYVIAVEDAAQGFRPLFNGKDLTGWKLRNPDGHPSWNVQNGMLVNEVIPDETHGTDLVSEETFRDFTIKYEYMVPQGSNSGMYLRGRHEIQILEDFESKSLSTGGNGGLYSIKPPGYFASLPPGRWQTVEATIQGDRVSVILNGALIHDNVLVNKATGGELDGNLDAPGPIMIQGDHGAVAFRNVRVRPIK